MCNVRDVCVIFYYFDILFCILFITSCKALVLIQISTILNRQRRIRPGIGIEVQVILKTWDTKKHYNYIGNKLKNTLYLAGDTDHVQTTVAYADLKIPVKMVRILIPRRVFYKFAAGNSAAIDLLDFCISRHLLYPYYCK